MGTLNILRTAMPISDFRIEKKKQPIQVWLQWKLKSCSSFNSIILATRRVEDAWGIWVVLGQSYFSAFLSSYMLLKALTEKWELISECSYDVLFKIVYFFIIFYFLNEQINKSLWVLENKILINRNDHILSPTSLTMQFQKMVILILSNTSSLRVK